MNTSPPPIIDLLMPLSTHLRVCVLFLFCFLNKIYSLRPCHTVQFFFLQRYSTLGRCKIGKYTFPSQFANIFLTYQTFVTNLHFLRVELRCKLPGKLHRVIGSLLCSARAYATHKSTTNEMFFD